MKPTLVRNRQIFQAANHTRSKQLGATLSKELREKYGRRSTRVVEGDTVRIMRGEYKGIDGKITRVSTEKNSVAVEGIKREKLKGGNIDIFIHTSNIMITGMNLNDKWRQNRLERQKTKTPKESPLTTSTKEKNEPEEKPKSTKETKKETAKESKKEKPKLGVKKAKQTKTARAAKKENK